MQEKQIVEDAVEWVIHDLCVKISRDTDKVAAEVYADGTEIAQNLARYAGTLALSGVYPDEARSYCNPATSLMMVAVLKLGITAYTRIVKSQRDKSADHVMDRVEVSNLLREIGNAGT